MLRGAGNKNKENTDGPGRVILRETPDLGSL